MHKELDTIQTLQALPASGLAAGAVGVVLEVFTTPQLAYLVEFADADGQTLAMPTLLPSQISAAKAVAA